MQFDNSSKFAIIEFFCQQVTRVGREVFHDQLAHDCFCENGPAIGEFQHVEIPVLQFIADAITEKIVGPVSQRSTVIHTDDEALLKLRRIAQFVYDEGINDTSTTGWLCWLQASSSIEHIISLF